jgi:hypothetical protein
VSGGRGAASAMPARARLLGHRCGVVGMVVGGVRVAHSTHDGTSPTTAEPHL